jgi:hypothetical protein
MELWHSIVMYASADLSVESWKYRKNYRSKRLYPSTQLDSVTTAAKTSKLIKMGPCVFPVSWELIYDVISLKFRLQMSKNRYTLMAQYHHVTFLSLGPARQYKLPVIRLT